MLHFNLIKNCLFSMQNRIFVVDAVWYCAGEVKRIEFTEQETEKRFSRSGKYIYSLIESGEIEYMGLAEETEEKCF